MFWIKNFWFEIKFVISCNKIFRKDIERDELYVLIIDEKVIGCITISSEKDVEYNKIKWLTDDAFQYYIHRLAIHPNFQHQGYAKIAMDFAETLGRQNHVVSIRLDTFSANERNQRFYETRGYQRLGEIYFPNQSDLCFYCYELILNWYQYCCDYRIREKWPVTTRLSLVKALNQYSVAGIILLW